MRILLTACSLLALVIVAMLLALDVGYAMDARIQEIDRAACTVEFSPEWCDKD